MTSLDVKRIYKEISMLTIGEKMADLSKLLSEVSSAVVAREGTDIYCLKGLGKEIWSGMEAQEYVDSERDSWAEGRSLLSIEG